MNTPVPEKIKIEGMEEYYVFQGESGALLIEMATKLNEILDCLATQKKDQTKEGKE